MSEGGENLNPQENNLIKFGEVLQDYTEDYGFVISADPTDEADHIEYARLILEDNLSHYELQIDNREVGIIQHQETETFTYTIKEDGIFENIITPQGNIERQLSEDEKIKLLTDLIQSKPDPESINSEYNDLEQQVGFRGERIYWASALPFPLPFPDFLKPKE